MRKAAVALATFAMLGLGAVGPAKAAMPIRVGQCVVTAIHDIGSRLDGDPSSGSDISYANGASQVSYDVVAQVRGWRAGDKVSMCLVSLPKGCPRGDTRGSVYRVTNPRTGTNWTEADSSHSCGGA
jgi:hypothetical protein